MTSFRKWTAEALTGRCSVKYGHRIILSDPEMCTYGECLCVSASVPASDVTVSCFHDGCFRCGGVTDPQVLGDHTAVSFGKLEVCLAAPQR